MILSIIFLTIMLTFFILSLIILIAELNKRFDKIYDGKNIETVCEKCKTKKMVTSKEYRKEYFSKSRSTTMTVLGNSITKYSYVAKKFHCDNCNKKTWHEILNFQSQAERNTKEYITPIIIFFLANYVFANGAILLYSLIQKLF